MNTIQNQVRWAVKVQANQPWMGGVYKACSVLMEVDVEDAVDETHLQNAIVPYI